MGGGRGEGDAQHDQQRGRRRWTRRDNVVGPANDHCRHRRRRRRGGAGANTGPNRGRGRDDTCNAVADTEGEGTLGPADATAREAERGDQNATGGARGVEDGGKGRRRQRRRQHPGSGRCPAPEVGWKI